MCVWFVTGFVTGSAGAIQLQSNFLASGVKQTGSSSPEIALWSHGKSRAQSTESSTGATQHHGWGRRRALKWRGALLFCSCSARSSWLCCISALASSSAEYRFLFSPPRPCDTELNRVCGTSRRVHRQLIVLRKLIWAWNWIQHPPRRSSPDSRRVLAYRRPEFVCIFSHNAVPLRWYFIIWTASSHRCGGVVVGGGGEKLTRASASASSWKSLALG